MATRIKVELNRPGVGRILRGPEMRKMVDGATTKIASGTRARIPAQYRNAEVTTEAYTTDRGAGAVILRHPRATGIEGKYGVLSAAARALGAQVRARGKG